VYTPLPSRDTQKELVLNSMDIGTERWKFNIPPGPTASGVDLRLAVSATTVVVSILVLLYMRPSFVLEERQDGWCLCARRLGAWAALLGIIVHYDHLLCTTFSMFVAPAGSLMVSGVRRLLG
jgi:hypothetical protein